MRWTTISVILLAILTLSVDVLAQSAKSSRRRSIDPCNTPDGGFGVYDKWDSSIAMGQMLAPQQGGLTADGGFDLMVHFHGHEPIRKEFAPVGGGIILVGIDLGVRTGHYAKAFSSPDVFPKLLRSVERAMRRKSGRERVYIRRIGLTSWSAGSGAIDQILRQPSGAFIDTLVLLDSLYGSYTDASEAQVAERSLKPFLAFAKRAQAGRTFMYQTHSEVPTYGYANTREVSQFMLQKLGGRLKPATRRDRLGLRLFERFERGHHRVRGYRGSDKPAHCGHIGVIRDVVRTYTLRRWKTPRGTRRTTARSAGEPRATEAAPAQLAELPPTPAFPQPSFDRPATEQLPRLMRLSSMLPTLALPGMSLPGLAQGFANGVAQRERSDTAREAGTPQTPTSRRLPQEIIDSLSFLQALLSGKNR